MMGEDYKEDSFWRVVRVAEGARLESVYARKCIEGSNPSLSATKSKSRRQSGFFNCVKTRVFVTEGNKSEGFYAIK